ncbi:MAG: hypothetical protein Q9157_003920 [Trypethelium eluteriae]
MSQRGELAPPLTRMQLVVVFQGRLIKQWYADENGPLYPWDESPSYYGQEIRNGILDYWRDEQDTPITWPHCNKTELRETNANCQGCWLEGYVARLFYWPVDAETIGSPDCPDSYREISTAPANKTPATTTFQVKDSQYNITSVYTFTSPTAYLSVNEIAGRDACDGFWGSPMLDVILPIPPQDLKSGILSFPGINGNSAAMTSVASVIAKGGNSDAFLGTGWQNAGGYQDPFALLTKTQVVPFNYADLGRRPPAVSYYFGAAGEQCIEDYFYKGWDAGGLPGGFPCDTIIDGFYTPLVQLGSAAQKLQPAWSSCTLGFGWDPPYALTAQSVAAAPVPATLTSARPQPTIPASPVGVPPVSRPTDTNIPVDPPATLPQSESTQDPGGNPKVVTTPMVASGDPQQSGGDPPVSRSQPASQTPISAPVVGDILPSILGGGGSSSSAAQAPAPVPVPASTPNPGGSVISIVGGGDTQGSSVIDASNKGDHPSSASTTIEGSERGSTGSWNDASITQTSAASGLAGTSTPTDSRSHPLPGNSRIPADSSESSSDGSVGDPVSNSGPSSILFGDPSDQPPGAANSGSPGISSGTASSNKPANPNDGSSLGSLGNSSDAPSPAIFDDSESSPSSQAIVIVGSETYTVNAASPSLALGSTALHVGSQGATLPNGQPISLDSNGIVLGSSTVAYSAASIPMGPASSVSQAVITIGMQAYTASGGSIAIGSQTLSAGGSAATISGQVISAGLSGIVAGSSTIPYSAAPTPTELSSAASQAVATVGTQAYTVSGDSILVGSQTLTAGGPAATVSGQVVSVDSSGIVVGTSTFAYSAVPQPSSSTGGATFTVGSSVVTTFEANGAIIVGSSTLAVGGPGATVDGQSISAESNGLVIGSSTTASFTQDSLSASGSVSGPIVEATFVAGPETLTASEVSGKSGAIVVSGHTLSVGGPFAVFDGHTVSDASKGVIIDGTSTAAFFTSNPSEGTGRGTSVSATANAAQPSTGAAVTNLVRQRLAVMGILGLIGWVALIAV